MMTTILNRAMKVTAIATVTAMGVVVQSGVAAGASTTARPRSDGDVAPTNLADLEAGDAIPGEYVVTLRADAADRVRTSGADITLSDRIDAVMGRLDEVTNRVDATATGQADGVPSSSVVAELPIVDGFGAHLSAVEAALLSTFDEVLSVEPSTAVTVATTPTGSGAGSVALPWGLDRIDQKRLPLDGAYRPQSVGSGVTAYVIDTGVWVEHNEYSGRAIEPMVDFVGDVESPDQVPVGCMDHGTHVAGTIVGRNVGVAPGATLRALRTMNCEGVGTTLTILRAMDWVGRNAQLPAVVNMSISGRLDRSFASAIRNLTAKGITVVVAAGNDAADACGSSPGFVPSAITVGATSAVDEVYWRSNTGPCVDLFAPGVGVVSAGVLAPDYYEPNDGTSMASPHVAGAAALYLSEHPTATPDAVERALVAGAVTGALANLSPGSPDRLLQVNDLPDPVSTPNDDPVAHISPPGGVGAIQAGEPVLLDGSRSFDPNGGTLSYQWRVQGRAGIVGTGPKLTATPAAIGGMLVSLTVTNPAGVTATAFLQLDVGDRRPPIAIVDPGNDELAVAAGTQLAWDASESFDPDGGTLTYEWYYTVGAEVVTASGPTFRQVFAGGDADLAMVVTNEYGASAVALVRIYEPLSPVAVITPSTVQASVGDTVLFDGSKSYNENGPADQLWFAWRDRAEGTPKSTAPTYRRTFDRAGTFTVYLTVGAFSGEIDTAEATVVVSEVEPPPPPVGPSALTAVAPVRVLDTRLGSSGVSGPKGRVAAGGVVQFSVAEVPVGAAGVVLNVTAVDPAGDGHLTVFPCGDRPGTSNVNYRSGVTTANAVVSKLGEDRALCVWSYTATDVVVDVTGYLPAGGVAHSVSSVRAIDTRSALGGRAIGAGRLAAGGVLRVPVSSAAKVPAGASAVFMNVTAVNPSADGHLTVYPCGAVPGTSNVNYRSGVTKANMVVVQLAKDGSLCVKTHAESDVVVDVLGYVDADGGVELTSSRKLDTRQSPLDGALGERGPVAGGSMVRIDLGVDAARTAGVFLNLVAVNPTGSGHLTVFPCGKPPTASVVNYRAGVTTSNMVFTKVDNNGAVCVSTFATTDLVIDYNGAVTKPT